MTAPSCGYEGRDAQHFMTNLRSSAIYSIISNRQPLTRGDFSRITPEKITQFTFVSMFEAVETAINRKALSTEGRKRAASRLFPEGGYLQGGVLKQESFCPCDRLWNPFHPVAIFVESVLLRCALH